MGLYIDTSAIMTHWLDPVPGEIDGVKVIESVIFALKTFNKIMEEESDDTLHTMQHLHDDQYGEKAKIAKSIAVRIRQ